MEAMEFHEAKNLPGEKRVAGLKVKGKELPFGGSWTYDKESDELTLNEPPTLMP